MGLKDKAENKVEDLKGQGKESAGKATGDEQLEAEGKGDQAVVEGQGRRREGQGRRRATSRTASPSSRRTQRHTASMRV